MDENEYKVSLGVDIDVSDIQSQINEAGKKVDPIQIKVEVENLDDIKKQLQNLGKNDKNTLTLDTTSLEASLKDVKNIITDIKSSIGTLDGKSGMKSLLSSINAISTALDKTSGKFDELIGDLKSLSGKDFSLNLDLNIGGSNPIARNSAYGSKVRNETLPQLKKQVALIEGELVKYYKKALKIPSFSQDRVFSEVINGTPVLENLGVDVFSMYGDMSSDALKSQIQGYKQYINVIKEAAKIKGIDLSGVTSQFSKSADQLVQDAIDVQTGAKETEEGFEKLKQIFSGGGVDVEGLGRVLEPIINDLREIKEFLQDLSSGISLEGLTQSFDKLSDTIEKLIQNATQVKNVFDNGLNTTVSDSGTEKVIQEQKELAQTSTQTANAVVQAEEKKQQSIKETANETQKAANAISLSKEAEKIKKKLSGSDLGFSNYDNEIDSVTAKFNKLENQSEQLQSDIKLLNSTFADIKSASAANDIEALVNANKEYEQVLARVKNQLDINSRAEKEAAAVAKKEASESAKAEAEIAKAEKEAVAVANKMQKEADAAALKETNAELNNLKNLAHQIGQLDFKIVKADYNDEINQVKEFERQLDLLKTQYNSTLSNLNQNGIDINSQEITREFANARAKIAEFEAQVKDTKIELAQNIKSNIGTTITRDVDKAHVNFDKLSNKTKELHEKLRLLDSIKVDLDEAAAVNDIDRLIDANIRYQRVLKDVRTQIDIAQRAEKVAFDKDAFNFDKQNAMLRLKNLFGENSEAAKRFASDLNRVEKELRECGDPKGLKLINKEIDVLGRKVKESGAQTQTFGQKLKHQFQQYSSYLSVASLFSYASQALRDMFEQVKLIDSAMTELKKVTNETDAAYNKFLSNAADRSKVIGTTIDGLVKSTADFARLGYGFKDAQGLAEVANIYAVVGDEIEGVEGATESLISTMAAFKDEMNGMSNTDFAMSIIDKFNEIGKLIA